MMYAEGIKVEFSVNDTPGGLIIGHCWIDPGYSLPLHHHEEDEIYNVIEGSGRLIIGKEEESLATFGSPIFIPGGEDHGITATSRGVHFMFIFPGRKWEDIEYIWK